MARPSVPLISKERVCELVLEMIDEDGIDALTIRKIAQRLDVNGASLYHHFKNKDEILAAAAELALKDARVPRLEGESWKTWCFRNVEGLHKVLRRHPDLIHVLVRRHSMHIGFAENDYYFGEFERQGLHVGLAWSLMEMLQAFAVGTVLHENAGAAAEPPPDTEYTNLDRATAERVLKREDEFRIGCYAIINALDAMKVPAEKRSAKRTASSSAASRKRASAAPRR